MKGIWRKYKLWISLLSYAAAVVLLLFFLVNPLIQKIKQKSEEIQKRTVDNEINLARISKLPEMKNVHETFVQEEPNLNIIVDSSREVDFIEKLETLAEETGNKIELKILENYTDQNASKSPAVSKGKNIADEIRASLPYGKYLVVQVSLEGNYDNFLNFIYKLENFDYYVNVLSISLGKQAQENTQESGSDPFTPSNANTGGSPDAKSKIIPKETLKSSINIAAYIK
jgi:hypothetical protein